MENGNTDLWRVQWDMQDYNLASCKKVAKWLTRHIKLMETDVRDFKLTIEDLGLSSRTYNVLKANDVTTIKQLLVLSSTRHSIQLLKGAGRTVAKEIDQKLRRFKDSDIFKAKKRTVLKNH